MMIQYTVYQVIVIGVIAGLSCYYIGMYVGYKVGHGDW